MLASVFIILTLTAFATAAPQKRQLAQVVSSCTQPNTVALTFVSLILCVAPHSLTLF